MQDPRTEKLAKVLTEYSLRVGHGDLLRIAGPVAAAPLIGSVYRQALCRGANPYVRVTLDGLEEQFLKAASEEQLRFLSELDRLEFELPTARLTIVGRSNTRDLANVPADRIARRRRVTRPLQERFVQRAAEGALRWCLTQYPTQAEAQEAEMSLTDYEEFVFRAGHLDADNPVAEWEQIRREQAHIATALAQRRTLHLRGPSIDLALSVAGRRWLNAAGEANFPDGEVYTGPVEDSVNGWLRSSFPAILRGHEVDGVELVFERGRVVRAEARKGDEFLQAMLGTDAGARYLGEAAFGLNYGIDRFTRNTLFDEKIGGTFHVALGMGYPETGAKNVSALHWDLICDLRSGAEVLADGELIYRDGRFEL